MKEERLTVLELIKEGKITVEDAVKLLEAIGKTERPKPQWQDNAQDKFKHIAKNLDVLGKEVGCKLDEVTKTASPKIKEFSQAAAEKTSALLDELSSMLSTLKSDSNSKKDADVESEPEQCNCGCEEHKKDEEHKEN